MKAQFKQWYELLLVDSKGAEETIAKVKSKGLAFLMLEAMKPIYENGRTQYTVIMR
jgi:hypothetical protein